MLSINQMLTNIFFVILSILILIPLLGSEKSPDYTSYFEEYLKEVVVLLDYNQLKKTCGTSNKGNIKSSFIIKNENQYDINKILRFKEDLLVDGRNNPIHFICKADKVLIYSNGNNGIDEVGEGDDIAEIL